ncbi:MAG: hypothetical protein LBC52_03305 [Treponema sp.]|jgi:hypothetical protein|nr:hypothetical protein [Treponema sp.]
MVSIRDNLISRLERQIGRKILYSSISPSLFGSFDVRNISIMGRDDIPLLTMSRFRIAYSLLDILRGRTLAIRSIQIDSPLVNYNTDTDKDLLDLFRTAMSGQEGPSRELAYMLPEKIVVRIRNGKCQVLSGSDNFAFDGLDINAEVFEKSIALDGKWNISVSTAKLFADRVNFQVAMTANGLCRMDMEDGAAIISIPSVSGDVSGEEPVIFNVSIQDGVVNISKKPDAFPFDMSFEYGKDGKEFEGRLSCDNFRLAQLVSFSGGLEGLRQMLDIASSGSASIGRGPDGVLGYSVNLAGAALSNLPLRTEAASYEITIEGDEKLAQVKKLRFSMPQAATREASFYGSAGFRGAVGFRPLAPDGVLSLKNFSISGRENLNADIAVNTGDSGINVSCDSISVGHGAFDIEAFKAQLIQSENGMIFSVSGARAADARQIHMQKKSFSLDGSFGPGFQSVDVKLSLDSFFAGDLMGLCAPFVKNNPMPDVLMEIFGDTAISTELSFYTDFTQVLYNTPNLVFSGKSGDKGFSGFASINGTGSHFELGKGQISRGEDTLFLSAQADFANPNNVDFSVDAGYRDISCLIKGTVQDGKTVNIQGSYGLKVNFTTSRGRSYSGLIHTEGFPIPFLGKPALLYLDGRLHYDSNKAWSMDFDRLELTDIITPAGLAQFRASCRADQNGVNFPHLYYKDGFGPLSGNINLIWPQSAGSEPFSEITGTAYLVENKENYQMEVSLKNHSLNFWLSGSSMRLGRFSEKANTLQADGEMRLLWNSADSFNAELNLSSLRGKMHERDINLSAQAVIDNDELTVRRIVIGINSLNGEIPQIVFNNKTGTAGSEGNLNLVINGKRTAGALSLKANFKPVNSWAEINEALDFFDGKAHVENFRFGDGAQPQSFDIAFTRGGDNSLIVSGGPRNMIRLQVDNNGNFYAGLSSPSPVRGTAIGNINGNTINATCNDLFIDMAGVFTYLLPQSKEIYLTGGYVNASMDIRGPLSDPEFFGSAKGTSLRFVIPSFIPVELRPIPANAVIEGNEITFGPVLASVGKGAGSVSGKFLIDRWVPNIFDINITVPRETPIPYSFGINNFAARGDASGKLNIAMENMTLDVSGDLYVNNTVLGMDSDEINKPQGQNEEGRSIVDLTISTGPIVEFFYPDSKFPILRANPDMGTKMRVTADTLTKQFSLTSDIKIRGGEIFYFERSFYIRSGLLVFRENELRFAPRLTARAESRDRNEDGPVTISLIVDNAPLFDFTARFESSPPLSQMDILALMGQSLTGSQADDTGANQRDKALTAFVNSGADMLAQFTIGRWFERQMRNFLQLDMFSLRTQVFQNFLFNAFPGLMQQPVDRNGVLGNYLLDNTTLLGGKYIGQDLYVQGMLSMRYDANRDTFGGMTFQPDIGLELQGPVVFYGMNLRIRWNFLPEHPENWYANDNAITFTFSKTY